MRNDSRCFNPKKCGALLSPEYWAQWNPPALLGRAGMQEEVVE